MERGRYATIERSTEAPGIRWARPFRLRAWNGFALIVVGRYPTEELARAAARRRGLKVRQ